VTQWATSALRVATDPTGADWALFVGLTGVVLTLFLTLARLSQSAVRDDVDPPGRLATVSTEESDASPAGTDLADETMPDADGATPRADGEMAVDDVEFADSAAPFDADRSNGSSGTARATATAEADDEAGDLSAGALLINVVFTQGLFGGILLAAAWYTEIPAWAFGLTAEPLSTGLPALLVGAALGVGLYVVNELGAAGADSMGVEYDERLRSMLAPDTAAGWVVLFVLVLPIIAGVEEFVFRAAVIGATTAGFGTSPWALAVVSSLAFALGHGAQGKLGVVVTGGLGFVLASAFIVTGSFLVVFVAHYLVNALEFAVHELLGIDWAGSD
jgi:membrane protease YdiL (CAAX protease family)